MIMYKVVLYGRYPDGSPKYAIMKKSGWLGAWQLLGVRGIHADLLEAASLCFLLQMGESEFHPWKPSARIAALGEKLFEPKSYSK